MHLDIDKINIKEFLDDYNIELDDASLAGLSQKDLAYRKDILSKIEERFKKERKNYDPKDADEIESLLDNLSARIRVVAERKRSDGRRLVNEFDQKNSELIEKQHEIEEKVEELLRYAYLAGFPIDKGKTNKITTSLNEEMNLDHIYLTEEAAIRFNKDDAMRNQRDKARLDRSTTNAYVEQFNNLYAYIGELVRERNQLRNECLDLNDKLDNLFYGGLIEGYDSFINIDKIPNPQAPDPNKAIKDIRNKLLGDFEKAVQGVNSYKDVMEMSLEDIRLLDENLTALNAKNAFDKQVSLARATVGSDKESLDILNDILYIQSAYKSTRKVVENIKGIKNTSVNQLRTAIKANKERIAELDKKIVEKQEEILKYRYILGLVNENALKKFAKENKREIITLDQAEEKEKERIAKGGKSTKDYYINRLTTASTELDEFKASKKRHEESLETYEKGKENVEKGILNGKYENLARYNANISIGMKKLEELRDGSIKFDRDVLKEASEGHTLDELEPKEKNEEKEVEKEEDKEVDLGDSIKEDDVELGESIEDDDLNKDKSEEKEVDLGEAISDVDDVNLGDAIEGEEIDLDDAILDKKGDKVEKDKKKNRIIPKIKGKLPKAAKVFLAVAGVLAAGYLIMPIFAGGTGQLLLAGAVADRVISSGLTKKK